MKYYHKINSVFNRDMSKKGAPFIMGEWSRPEFEELNQCQWVGTEKVDGTNIAVHWDGFNVRFFGRSDKSAIPSPLLRRLEQIDGVQDLPINAILYGEGFGGKIQKVGKLYGATDFVLFDVFINGVYLRRADVDDIAAKIGVKSVPEAFSGTLTQALAVVENGQRSAFGDLTSEGLILTPVGGFLNRQGHRIITKIKHKDFR